MYRRFCCRPFQRKKWSFCVVGSLHPKPRPVFAGQEKLIKGSLLTRCIHIFRRSLSSWHSKNKNKSGMSNRITEVRWLLNVWSNVQRNQQVNTKLCDYYHCEDEMEQGGGVCTPERFFYSALKMHRNVHSVNSQFDPGRCVL